jgi:hypothetical protein
VICKVNNTAWTNAYSTERNQTESLLLRLPLELRGIIYKYTFDTVRIQPKWHRNDDAWEIFDLDRYFKSNGFLPGELTCLIRPGVSLSLACRQTCKKSAPFTSAPTHLEILNLRRVATVGLLPKTARETIRSITLCGVAHRQHILDALGRDSWNDPSLPRLCISLKAVRLDCLLICLKGEDPRQLVKHIMERRKYYDYRPVEITVTQQSQDESVNQTSQCFGLMS